MKVLGVGDDKYICEVSWAEMYEITGSDELGEESDFKAGDEISLTQVVRAADWIKKLDTKHIDNVIRELQLALVGVEKVKQTATALNLFNKLSKEHVDEAL